jgi:molybdate transport system ATP-binding protein
VLPERDISDRRDIGNDRLALDVQLVLQKFRLQVRTAISLHGVTGLFGESGSGKSTLLRIIAGFAADASGTLSIDGRDWLNSGARLNVPAHRRPIAYVFQDARLFTHLDVQGNLQFAAKRNGGAGPQFDEVVAALDLAPLLGRAVDTLSGGERQRVALGRALLCNPRLLLLDEPLAALDARRKQDIMPYLESLQARFSLPTIYVSHSIDEILRLADEVVVLQGGRVIAQGETRSVLNGLGTVADSRQFEVSSVLEGVVTQQLPDLCLTELRVGEQSIVVPAQQARAPGSRMLLRVRAGEVALATAEPAGISIRNVLRGRISRIEADSARAFALVHVDIDGTVLRCQLTRQAILDLQLQPGMAVFALLKTASFDAHD